MMDKSRYPDNWKEISHRIRFERAGGKCEQCGVRHGEWIVRQPGTAYYLIYDAVNAYYCEPNGNPIKMSELPAFWADAKETRVVLTVHHIGAPKDDGSPGDMHDKMDCRDVNLIALCQRCHLLADLPEHIKGAKATRLKKKHAAIQTYQKSLWGE